MVRFKKDQRFLLKYNAKLILAYFVLLFVSSLLTNFESVTFGDLLLFLVPAFLIGFPHVVVALVGILLYIGIFYSYFEFHWYDLGVLFLSAYIGCLSASLMHNAAHMNFPKKWLAIIVGEICAVQQLVGYREWQIAHVMYHHPFSDNPEKDPHAPQNMSFIKFLITMKFGIARAFESYYFRIWSKTEDTQKIWGLTGLCLLTSVLLRTFFWFIILGPKYFLVAFITSYIVTNILYAHFNYYTHRPTQNGKTEILDLKDGIYVFYNFLMMGGYYHKTHHKHPNYFNPKKAAIALNKQNST